MRRLVMLFSLASTLCGTLSAADARPASSQPAVILELFTSEGCSSCPPADTLLREVNLKRAASGQVVVGISEHVTYWNRLGWKDPYSQEIFTERQGNYASRFALDSAYTPQMVLNGREQFVGGDSARLSQALQEEAARRRVTVSIAATASDAPTLDVEVHLQGNGSQPLDVFAAITDDVDRSNVLRGENAGSLLEHVAVARTLEMVGTARGQDLQHFKVQIPSSLRASLHVGHHLIVFLQEPHQGAILGAATQAL